MRPFFVLLLIFLFFPLNGCLSQNMKDLDNENIAQEQYTWDFGKVKEEEILKHDFKFKNDTSKKINIKDLNSSCGCTVSKVTQKELLSGQATDIEVQFNSKGYFGFVKQFIYVHTDDLDNPVVRYIIKAEVVK